MKDILLLHQKFTTIGYQSRFKIMQHGNKMDKIARVLIGSKKRENFYK
jgi:hypothetical protein